MIRQYVTLLACTVAVLSLCTPAPGATGVNIIVNPGAESGPGGNGGDVLAAPGWTATGNATVVLWGTGGGFPVASDAGPSDRGENFFSGGPNQTPTAQTQTVDVSADAVGIDAGTMGYTLSGYLGGYSGQDDNATLTAEFFSQAAQSLGVKTIGPVSALDRNTNTGLLERSAVGTVPVGTRSITFTVTFTRTAGSYNDGYADSLSFIMTPPQSCPGDFNHDGLVNTADLTLLLVKFGLNVPLGTEVDMDGNGVVNTGDLTRFLVRFGNVCP